MLDHLCQWVFLCFSLELDRLSVCIFIYNDNSWCVVASFFCSSVLLQTEIRPKLLLLWFYCFCREEDVCEFCVLRRFALSHWNFVVSVIVMVDVVHSKYLSSHIIVKVNMQVYDSLDFESFHSLSLHLIKSNALLFLYLFHSFVRFYHLICGICVRVFSSNNL